MSISKSLFDQTRLVPETDETGWGSEVTEQLVDLLDCANSIHHVDGSDNIHVRYPPTTSSLAAGATLTPTAPCHRVAGTPGAVTLAGIASGSKDGQLLVLLGSHAVNTVSLTYSATLLLNGDITLASGDVLRLIWDNSNTRWVELNRSN